LSEEREDKGMQKNPYWTMYFDISDLFQKYLAPYM
jgi:hypothetical protein